MSGSRLQPPIWGQQPSDLYNDSDDDDEDFDDGARISLTFKMIAMVLMV